MIIIISSQGKTMQSPSNPRFGRTPYFIKFNLDKDTWEALPNQAQDQRGGAGVAASQFMIDQNAQVVISGRFGPNAYQALKGAGIKMMTFSNQTMTVSDVITAYKSDQLEEVQ